MKSEEVTLCDCVAVGVVYALNEGYVVWITSWTLCILHWDALICWYAIWKNFFFKLYRIRFTLSYVMCIYRKDEQWWGSICMWQRCGRCFIFALKETFVNSAYNHWDAWYMNTGNSTKLFCCCLNVQRFKLYWMLFTTIIFNYVYGVYKFDTFFLNKLNFCCLNVTIMF